MPNHWFEGLEATLTGITEAHAMPHATDDRAIAHELLHLSLGCDKCQGDDEVTHWCYDCCFEIAKRIELLCASALPAFVRKERQPADAETRERATRSFNQLDDADWLAMVRYFAEQLTNDQPLLWKLISDRLHQIESRPRPIAELFGIPSLTNGLDMLLSTLQACGLRFTFVEPTA